MPSKSSRDFVRGDQRRFRESLPPPPFTPSEAERKALWILDDSFYKRIPVPRDVRSQAETIAPVLRTRAFGSHPQPPPTRRRLNV